MLTNAKIKEIKNLCSKAKARREMGLFVIEGPKLLLEAPEELIHEVYITEELKANPSVMEKVSSLKSVTIVTPQQLKRISDTETPQGVLAVLKQIPREAYKTVAQSSVASASGLAAILLEDIQDPGNLGTIIRTAEAAGVGEVIMSRGCVDIYNPKVVRATMGSIYRVPFRFVEDIKDAIGELQSEKIEVYAAALDGAKSMVEISLKGQAVLIGNEGNGLKRETIAAASGSVYIPMYGKVESLNASIAATVLMYAAVGTNGNHF